MRVTGILKYFENLHRPRQGVLRLGPSPTGHYPVIRPSGELVPLSPHLLIKGSQQDIAQQWRDDSSLRSSPWSRDARGPRPDFARRSIRRQTAVVQQALAARRPFSNPRLRSR